MYHKTSKNRRTDQPRLVHLTDGRGIMLHRTGTGAHSAFMGMCGPVDQWDTIAALSHYRFYTLAPDPSGRLHIARKYREARS